MTRKRNDEWYSTPKAKRKRKPLEITLSERARVALETLAWSAEATLSATVEVLIITAAARARGGARGGEGHVVTDGLARTLPANPSERTLLDDVDAYLAEKAELGPGT